MHSELYRIRHSLAHVLAQAVKRRFPDAKLGFGPPTDNGFYYDFDFGAVTVTNQDLKELEKIMKKIIAQKHSYERLDTDKEGALELLRTQGDEHYKCENVEMLFERGERDFSFYRSGDFLDLCEGPHVEDTGKLPAQAFKLDRIAGAYWLGDENNKMLTRIYGLAFEDRDQLDNYLQRRKAAEDFDHKKLGRELKIFRNEDLVGKGMPLWLPNGAAIRDAIEDFAREKEFLAGYRRVATPHVAKAELFYTSKHLPAYKESMFPPMTVKDEGGEHEQYYLKPMNCPFHHLIYRSETRSYRDLPVRLSEYGTVYRYEQSGEVSGLIRVRCMCMNDAHLYIRPDQFKEEFKAIMSLYQEFYSTFGLKDYKYRLSIRGEENADKFQGDPASWDMAEKMLAEAMDEMNMPYFVGKGEAAFYGPKIDIQFKNLLGREETVSTVQVDFLAAKNFELHYVDDHGQEQDVVVLHRAPLSTHERFLSFLMEYYGGAFPTWCAPVQVVVIPVGAEQHAYATSLRNQLHQSMVRVEWDDSQNSFNKKIRTHTVRKIPIILIVGTQESEAQTVTVRRYGVKEQQTLPWTDFLSELHEEIRTRKLSREPMASLL